MKRKTVSDFLRDKSAKTSCIEHTSHTDHTLTWETTHLQRQLRHGIERIGDHNDDTMRGIFHHLLGYLCNDMIAEMLSSQSHAANSKVITFRATARECDLRG